MKIEVMEAEEGSGRWYRCPRQIDEYIEPTGELVSTRDFKEFQRSLSAINPNLKLGFDRLYGFWCVIRIEPELRKMDIPESWTRKKVVEDGKTFHVSDHTYPLCYYHKVPNVLFHLKHGYFEEDGSIRWEPRPPASQWLDRVAKMERDQISADNNAWASRRITEFGLDVEQKRDQEIERRVQDASDDFHSTTSKTNPFWDKTYHTAPEMPK